MIKLCVFWEFLAREKRMQFQVPTKTERYCKNKVTFMHPLAFAGFANFEKE